MLQYCVHRDLAYWLPSPIGHIKREEIIKGTETWVLPRLDAIGEPDVALDRAAGVLDSRPCSSCPCRARTRLPGLAPVVSRTPAPCAHLLP
jgi:hypothetical protein